MEDRPLGKLLTKRGRKPQRTRIASPRHRTGADKKSSRHAMILGGSRTDGDVRGSPSGQRFLEDVTRKILVGHDGLEGLVDVGCAEVDGRAADLGGAEGEFLEEFLEDCV